MGLDINWSISKILTKQEIEDLKAGRLYFENYYSLNLITKEEAEKIKKETLYNILMECIIPENERREDFITQLKINEDNTKAIEDWLCEEWLDKDEMPCSWEQRQDYLYGYGCWAGLEIKPLDYKGEEVFILIEILYG